MNKKRGKNFENEFAKILMKNNFWARLDKGFAQTCDIIAGKNGKIFLFECKTCVSDYFNLERVEDNQSDSREWFKSCKNNNAWFVFKVDGIGIFLSKEAIKKPSEGIKLERWLEQWT